MPLAPTGPGGLVAAVAPVINRTGGTWLSAPTSAAEAELSTVVAEGIEHEGVSYRLLDLPAAAHHDHFTAISSELLLPLFHYLLPLAERPAFTERSMRAWDGYRLVNSIYAEAIRRHRRECLAVLVEDVHLMLVGAALRNMPVAGEPVAPLSYFHHVPWCEPDYFGVLPESVRTAILTGLLSYDSAGFHCRRWLEAFWVCCERFVPGVARTGDRVTWRDREIRLVASRAAIDIEHVAVHEGTADRIARSVALREAVAAHTPGDWVRDRLDGLCAAAHLERL